MGSRPLAEIMDELALGPDDDKRDSLEYEALTHQDCTAHRLIEFLLAGPATGGDQDAWLDTADLFSDSIFEKDANPNLSALEMMEISSIMGGDERWNMTIWDKLKGLPLTDQLALFHASLATPEDDPRRTDRLEWAWALFGIFNVPETCATAWEANDHFKNNVMSGKTAPVSVMLALIRVIEDDVRMYQPELLPPAP